MRLAPDKTCRFAAFLYTCFELSVADHAGEIDTVVTAKDAATTTNNMRNFR
jgi:hypothetical protein